MKLHILSLHDALPIFYNATWTYNGGMDPAAAQPIYNAVGDYMRTNNVPGLSLAIARNGRLVFAKGFGLADQSANEWVDRNSTSLNSSHANITYAVLCI